MKKSVRMVILSLMILFSGCQRSNPSAEPPMETTAEVPQQTSIAETQQAELAETEEDPSWQDMDPYQWMVNLKAEDVEFIEFVFLSDSVTPYRRYEGEEIQEVIGLFQNNMCIDYASSASWQGYFTKEFHIVMKDGTAHTVCSIGTVTTVIDGAAFDTISAWIIGWPETGHAPLPADWEQKVSSRNYHMDEEASFLGTSVYERDREYLDYQYDREVSFGSASRNYPIGRGVIALYAEQPSATGVSLKAYWTGSYGGRQVSVKPEYWLERWDENTERYHAIETESQLLGTSRTLKTRDYVYWYIPWGHVYGSLQPGHYRIGMTFSERVNGSEQNETVCYAKFCMDTEYP